jgi:hypothetical protein
VNVLKPHLKTTVATLLANGAFTEDGEIRVNQSDSVALSAEEVRGPPQRKWLIIMALLTQRKSYEPGGRGFKSCRARQFSNAYEPQTRLVLLRGVLRDLRPDGTLDERAALCRPRAQH